MPHGNPTRRRLLVGGALAAASLGFPPDAPAQELTATPACHNGDAATLRQTEGPFYKPRSPERVDLRDPGLKGRPIEIAGLVLTRACQPVGRALVDLWHADDSGDYDNSSFRCRGHVFTDADGRWRFLTIVPAVYTGRARHFHVKVLAPGKSLLTTQLYFPNEPGNSRDSLFRKELLLRTAEAGDATRARFDFVVA